jgi:hypothetical protein
VSQIEQSPPSRQPAAAAPPEGLLIRYVKAHVRKGEQAKDKAEQHFIAAGRYLVTLKVTYAPTWQHWEDLLRIKVGLSTGRASELMQIADGRKDLQQIRESKAQSVARLREQKSSLRSEEKSDDADELFDEGPTTRPAATPSPGNKDPESEEPELAWAEEHELIAILARLDPSNSERGHQGRHRRLSPRPIRIGPRCRRRPLRTIVESGAMTTAPPPNSLS